MMRGAVPVFLLSVIVAASAHASNDQMLRAPAPHWVVPSGLMDVPEDAAGLMFVRRQDVLIHLDDEGQSAYLGFQVRILHPSALQMGNVTFNWNPAAGAPTVHALRVHRSGETIDVLERARFDILRRESQLEAAVLDGTLTAMLRVPDLRVGDELEFALTIRGSDPTLGSKRAGVLSLAPDPAPGRFRLGLSWDDGHEPYQRMTPDLADVALRQGRTVVIRLDHPPMLSLPADAPPRYWWQRIVEFSHYPDWEGVSRHFAPLYTRAASLDPGSPLHDEVRRIAAAHASPLDRARAALRLVQQEVRYIYVGLGEGNLTPATAEETWQRRYGDCKGKTAMLLALLRELGIEAEPVLASNGGADDGLDERLPNPGLFDHVLVRARINGSDYWLDGTLPPVAAPSVMPVFPYRWVLPLTAAGGSIEPISWRVPDTPYEIALHEIDARAGFDQPARITHTTIMRGIAGLQQYAQLSGTTPAQLLGGARQQMVGSTWQEIDDARWRYDEEAQASVLTISGTGLVDWAAGRDGIMSLTLPGGGFSPPARRVRPGDQHGDWPYYNPPGFSCHVTTVRLPDTSDPSGWSFNSGFDTRLFGQNYYRAFDLRDGAVRLVRSLRVEEPEIDAVTARSDNHRISVFDNSMARITYNPAGNSGAGTQDVDVPATYEINWLAERVPCLAPVAFD